MTAAHQLWTDDPRSNYEPLGRVIYIGPTLAPPPLLACALGDAEDNPPLQFRRSMPDPNDTRNEETLVPPTDREAPTGIEHEAPQRRDAVAPPAPIAPAAADSIFLTAVKDITDAARTIREERESRRAFEEAQLELQRQTLAAIERAERNGETNWRNMAGQLESWRRVSQDKDADHDKRLEALELQMAALKDELVALVSKATSEAAERIGLLERELQELKANVPRSPSTIA